MDLNANNANKCTIHLVVQLCHCPHTSFFLAYSLSPLNNLNNYTKREREKKKKLTSSLTLSILLPGQQRPSCRAPSVLGTHHRPVINVEWQSEKESRVRAGEKMQDGSRAGAGGKWGRGWWWEWKIICALTDEYNTRIVNVVHLFSCLLTRSFKLFFFMLISILESKYSLVSEPQQ